MSNEEKWVIESLGEFLNTSHMNGNPWGSLEGAFVFNSKEDALSHIWQRAFSGPPENYRVIDTNTAIVIEAIAS